VVITEVRIKLMEDNNERLLAFCSVTFDDMFVVRDLKIIEGAKGSFVAMPSRKLTDRCPQCGSKNHLRARYCNQCGHKLDEDRATRDADGRAKLHADIAHPINSACREVIQTAILKSYHEEKERSKQPGYVCSYDDLEGDGEETYTQVIGELNAPSRGNGSRTHVAHGVRGGHKGRLTDDPATSSTVAGHEEQRAGDFGAGIL
jgi:stage V sporulation protein G